MLIMHSDGMTSRWTLSGSRRPPRAPSGDRSRRVLHRDYKRGRDDATVVVDPARLASGGRADERRAVAPARAGGGAHRELAETNHGVVALYAELDDNAVRLREASELKSRFLSYMSHEFRTPLGAIRSIARILLDRLDGPLTDEQERQVAFMQSSATELSEMVDDLLDLAKVEAGRVTISPAWFEMVDLFSALRGMFKPIPLLGLGVASSSKNRPACGSVLRRQEAVADPPQLHRQRAEVHRRAARCA
jgi:signal transduction histidine kinase